MRSLLLSFFLCGCSFLQAEKVVQCIANYPLNAEMYTRFLQEKGYDGRVEVVNVKDYEGALLKRKGLMHRLLRRVGCDFPFRAQVPEGVEKIVFFNVTPSVCKKYDLSRLPKEKLVLFMAEPKTVLRGMYRRGVQAWFSKVYTWDDSLVDGVKYFKFNYGVLREMIPDLVPFEERKLCTLVASDLVGRGKNELYSKRREAIAYFERVKERGFEFYGKRWNPALYSSYRGEVADKVQAMKNYRFCICYENTQGAPGYITEKIFDCFAAGVVPVYWGASNVEKYIPKGCFIDRRDFENMDALHDFLKGMDKETHKEYVRQIQLFLRSKAAEQFSLSQELQHFYESLL